MIAEAANGTNVSRKSARFLAEVIFSTTRSPAVFARGFLASGDKRIGLAPTLTAKRLRKASPEPVSS